MDKIAIFGGSGFLGVHLARELIKRNKEVFIFDIKPPHVLNLEVNYIDVKDFSIEETKKCLLNIDKIIDLVYSTNPKTSFEDPIIDILDNLPNTIKLFKIANQLSNLKKFIYVSSGGTVYGNAEVLSIAEDYNTNPISPYGITKLAIEKYGLMYHQTNNLPFVIARPSNAYGVGQRINTGQGFIIHAIESIIKNKEISIYGLQGTIRDYIYVTDISNAISNLIDNSTPGEAYNIGTGIGISNIEIIDRLEPYAKKINKKIKIKFEKERDFDVNRNVLDCSKIEQTNNWTPQISIDSGIELTWNWLLKRYIV